MKKIFVPAALLSAFIAAPVVASRLATVIVSGDTATGENQPGWMFNRDPGTATPFEFNGGASSIGFGSLYVQPIQNVVRQDKFVGELFMLSPLADVESISFDFKIGASDMAGKFRQFYMNVYTNRNGTPVTNFYECRYDVIATSGSTTDFTTVTFDPTLTYPVAKRGTWTGTCPASPANLGAGATVRAISVNVGDTTFSDQGLDAYLDNVVVQQSGGATVYDFEPVPTSAADCKNGGWQNYGFRNQGQCIQFVNTGK
jgi:hypothetical protein